MKPFKGPPTYAAIPGTGPAGRTCGQCCHRRIYDSRGKHTDWVCQKTAEMPIAPPSRLALSGAVRAATTHTLERD